MISREEAIEIIKYASAFNSANSPLTKALDMAIEALSQPPADQWIPCSEELPEGYTAVIACSTDGDIHLNHYMTERGYWYYYKDEITAWMPLPEPYKGLENK
jgi:hypothetical protein